MKSYKKKSAKKILNQHSLVLGIYHAKIEENDEKEVKKLKIMNSFMKESIKSYYKQLFSTISDKSCMECCKHFSKKAAVSNLGLNICKYDCTKCNVAFVAKDYFDNNLVDTTVRNLKVETDGSMANEDIVQLSDISGKNRAHLNVPDLLDRNILQGMKIVDLNKEKENLENENKECKSAINENERVVQEATMTLKSQKEESVKNKKR